MYILICNFGLWELSKFFCLVLVFYYCLILLKSRVHNISNANSTCLIPPTPSTKHILKNLLKKIEKKLFYKQILSTMQNNGK